MSKFNYCEFFRFNDKYCDVFEEEEHYLYCEAESFDGRPGCITCKEYTPATNGPGYIVSCYAGAAAVYLQGLKPAPEDVARGIIASEERYTLECMAPDYGYSREYVVDAYRECIADGDEPHEAFVYIACCMMERDL